MDMRTDGIETKKGAKAPRGRKDKDKDDGAVIALDPLKKSLRDLGHLATKAAEAKERLGDAVRAVAKKSGLNAATIRRLVRAHSKDRSGFDDERAKVEQLGMVFEEIAYEGEITKALDA